MCGASLHKMFVADMQKRAQVGSVTATVGIDCHWVHFPSMHVARMLLNERDRDYVCECREKTLSAGDSTEHFAAGATQCRGH